MSHVSGAPTSLSGWGTVRREIVISQTRGCENGRLIVEKSCEFKGKSVSRRNSELGEDLSQIRANTCGRATSRVGSPFQKRKIKKVERKLSEKITQTSLFRAYLFIAAIG